MPGSPKTPVKQGSKLKPADQGGSSPTTFQNAALASPEFGSDNLIRSKRDMSQQPATQRPDIADAVKHNENASTPRQQLGCLPLGESPTVIPETPLPSPKHSKLDKDIVHESRNDHASTDGE
ncbi:hypothetical protein MMC06_006696 [Schaereria dolodes]|nr:hypothetical protein [Schaereria dolodes]